MVMLSWARIGALVLAVVLPLVSCDSLSNRLGIITEWQIESAKGRIGEFSTQIPNVPSAILIQKVGTLGDSRDATCVNYYLLLLYGTNENSYEEVLGFYRSVALTHGWQPRIVSNDTQAYITNNDVAITIGKNYGYDPFSGTFLGEGETKFKTVFLITLGTPVVLPYPEYCLHRQG